jgi:hypothetical protein
MIKVDRLDPGVLLITNSVGLINDQIFWRRFCKFLMPQGSKGLLPLPIRIEKITAKYTPIT